MLDIFTWFLIAVLFTWTFYSLLFFTFFWYEAVNGRYWEKIAEKYSINLKLFSVKAILTSICNLSKVWIYWPFKYVSNYWVLPESSPSRTPIVFVHGYFHNRSAWVKYFRWLKKEGFTHLLALDLKGKFNGIEKYAKQLEEEVEKLTRKYGVDKVDIVAHSMGGLVSRYYIQKLGGSKKVRKLVTLGTPHNGTKVAVFVLGKARPQMLPGSNFLEEISTKDSGSLGGTELTVLYSDADFMIVPSDLARVNAEGIENRCVGLISHIGFIYNKSVFRNVLSILTSD